MEAEEEAEQGGDNLQEHHMSDHIVNRFVQIGSEDDSDNDFADVPYQPLNDTDDEETQDYGYSLITYDRINPSNGDMFSDDEELEYGMYVQSPDATAETNEKELGADVNSEAVFEEIEQRLAELELQPDELSMSIRTTATTVETTPARPLSPRKKSSFSFDSPFVSSIDVESTNQLKEKAFESFDSKYQEEMNSTMPAEVRSEHYPQLTREYVDDIKAAMQGIQFSLPPLAGYEDGWQELLAKRTKKRGDV